MVYTCTLTHYVIERGVFRLLIPNFVPFSRALRGGQATEEKHGKETMETQAWKQEQNQVVSFGKGRTLVRNIFSEKLRFFLR